VLPQKAKFLPECKKQFKKISIIPFVDAFHLYDQIINQHCPEGET